MQILLVEDCANAAEYVIKALSGMGHEVELADSLERAEELANLLGFDAIVLDIMVRGESTYTFAKRLQDSGQTFCFASDVDHSQIPVELGNAPVLPKPYSMSSLVEMLDHLALLNSRKSASHALIGSALL
jgi:DNA-binding response OmpR family regulator